MQKEVQVKNKKRRILRNVGLCFLGASLFGVIMMASGLVNISGNNKKNLSEINSVVESVYRDDKDDFYCITIKENKTIYRISYDCTNENIIKKVPVGSEIKVTVKTSLIGRDYAEIYALSVGENKIIEVDKMIKMYYENNLGAVILGGAWTGVWCLVGAILLIIALKKPKEITFDYVESVISEEFSEDFIFYQLDKHTATRKLIKRQSIIANCAWASAAILLLARIVIEETILSNIIIGALLVGGLIAFGLALILCEPRLNDRNADKYAKDYLDYIGNCKYIDEENEYEFSKIGLVCKAYHDPDIDCEEEISEEVAEIEASVPMYKEGEENILEEVPEEIARDLEAPLAIKEERTEAEYVTEAVVSYSELNLYAACRYKGKLQVATIFICSNLIYENTFFGAEDIVLELTPKFYHDIKENDIFIKGLDYLTHNFVEEIRARANKNDEWKGISNIVKYENY